MIPKWQKGLVKAVEQVTPGIRKYKVELIETEVFDFLPGQFVTLDLPISEQRNKRWRSYSIASAPHANNSIELIIGLVKDGLGTHYLFDTLNVGDVLTLRGPQGTFQLPDVSNRDLFLICTGTGLAPFRSMVNYVWEHHVPHQQIFLIFGTRTRQDLLCYEELNELQSVLPQFQYLPTLSRENWQGRHGYVHEIYEELCSRRQPAVFMLCGWRPMVDEAQERILRLGYSSKDVIIELYG